MGFFNLLSMIKSYLHNNYPDALIEQLTINEEYGYTINRLTSKKDKIQLLFTLGLGNVERTVKEGFEQYKRTEIYFNLPDYLNLAEQDWCLNWINKIAQIPQKHNTWFGSGDTIPAGNPPQKISPQFIANHFILSKPIDYKDVFETIYNEYAITFLVIIPIFQSELDFKIRNSGTVLIDRIIKKGNTDRVDLFRKNVCRKRFLGF